MGPKPRSCWQAVLYWVPIELVGVELAEDVEVEAVDVAAMTQGDARRAAAIAIPATAAIFAVLAFILPSGRQGPLSYLLDFRDDSIISAYWSQEAPLIRRRRDRHRGQQTLRKGLYKTLELYSPGPQHRRTQDEVDSGSEPGIGKKWGVQSEQSHHCAKGSDRSDCSRLLHPCHCYGGHSWGGRNRIPAYHTGHNLSERRHRLLEYNRFNDDSRLSLRRRWMRSGRKTGALLGEPRLCTQLPERGRNPAGMHPTGPHDDARLELYNQRQVSLQQPDGAVMGQLPLDRPRGGPWAGLRVLQRRQFDFVHRRRACRRQAIGDHPIVQPSSCGNKPP